MTIIQLALPKGRMEQGVLQLLNDAGIKVKASSRGYRPTISLPDFDTKVLKPQNIVEMLDVGSRDIGFAGADWVDELNAEVVELLDTGLDQVRLVVAAPGELLKDGKLPRSGPGRPLLIASEFEQLTTRWIQAQNLDARFVRSFGATEVFPPEDADCIVDVAATGATLAANGLHVVGEVKRSSTRLYAHPRAMQDPAKRAMIEPLVLILKAVLEARKRVMIELNVPRDRLEAVCKVLPCMREPTISPLHGEAGYAVKSAVPRDMLPTLIPELKKQGGSDIVVSTLSQIVP